MITTDTFFSVTSISAWAQTKNGILWFDDNMPYVQKGELYYYFGMNESKEYRLICTSENDLGEQK